MPRKSAAALLHARFVPNERPKPPEALNPEEAAHWVRIVGSMPADWFTQEAWPLLIQLCRCAAISDSIAHELKRHKPGTSIHNKLFNQHIRVTKEISTLSVKFRLTPQTRRNAASARRATKEAIAAQHNKQPWS